MTSWWWLLFRYQKWWALENIYPLKKNGVNSSIYLSNLRPHEKCQKCSTGYIPNQQKLPQDFPHKERFTPIEFPFLSIQKSLFHGEMPCLPVVVAWHESLTPQLPGWKQRDLSLWRIPRSPPRRAKRPVTNAFHWRQRYREMRRWKMQIVCVYHNSLVC